METEFSLGMVILFPLATSLAVFALGGGARRWLEGETGRAASVYVSLFGSSMAFFFLIQAIFGALVEDRIVALVDEGSPWLAGTEIAVQGTLVLDPLSGAVALAIAALASLTQIFVVGWGAERADTHRLLAWIGAAEGVALLLVMASSLGLLVGAWFSLGVLTYLASGWNADVRAGQSARRHLQLELAGSALLLVMALLLVAQVPSFELDAVRLAAAPGFKSVFRTTTALGLPLAELAVFLVLVACSIRCGQLPFHAGIEGSSRAPLPLLAFAQGAMPLMAVYVVVRLEALFAIAPMAMALLAVVGSSSAVFGAVIALGEERIERVLTYSTISQYGLVFAALGVGAWAAAVTLAVLTGIVKAGLALSCAAASSGDGTLRKTRVTSPVVVRASFVLTAALGGLLPFGGVFAFQDVALHVLTHESAWSDGLNYFGFAACLFAAAATSAYAFRLHYSICPRPGRPDPREQGGAYAVVTATLAALAVGMGAFCLPSLMRLPRLMEIWLRPTTPIGGAFSGLNREFHLGVAPHWSGPDGVPDGPQWFVFLSVATACLASWRLTRSAWVARRLAPTGWVSALVGAARWVARAEIGVWAALERVADAFSSLLRVGVDEIAVDRGSHALGVALGDAGRRLRSFGEGAPRRATVGILVGVAFVLGWIYFKPSVASLGPNTVHDFGGLRPTLKRPADSKRRRVATPDPPATEPPEPEPAATGSGDTSSGEEVEP